MKATPVTRNALNLFLLFSQSPPFTSSAMKLMFHTRLMKPVIPHGKWMDASSSRHAIRMSLGHDRLR